MKTFMAKEKEIERKWYIIDAEGKPLGRVASEAAKILRGKNKPIFTPHTDTGDYLIILNAAKVVLTGNKLEDKMYRHHTNYPGGLKEVPYKVIMDKFPERAMEKAVKGMLPKNSLGRDMFRKLKVYKGPEHDQQAQKPELIEIDI
ncbi:MAG: 50S ribosomal protein L13 [Eubacteriales bacterium]|nr:50S ribosomal protein L13 [Eubacteriales bacterium]